MRQKERFRKFDLVENVSLKWVRDGCFEEQTENLLPSITDHARSFHFSCELYKALIKEPQRTDCQLATL